ncbi:MAG: alpha-amylase [Nitrospirae bacterium]|nr:alpha-amylase [Nitrospirota bacterium]
MSDPTSIDELDLSPRAGKRYVAFDREFREEFIYFLLLDRFHDGKNHPVVNATSRSTGFPAPDGFYGGRIEGITKNLDYIADLGCTAVWLSPIFESNAYHGYDITNYLAIDPRFGSKQDLIDLVDAAHSFQKNGKPWPLRIILDVVINHSGDNWSYPADQPYYYWNDQQFPFDAWRRPDRPVPIEFRDPNWYHRRGQIRNYDQYPEYQHGDISGLKDFAHDDDPIGSRVINALIMAHCYWIREADVDGFRVDAVKHMSEVACSRFCSNVREYAYALGKRGFFLFGEVATPSDDLYNRYIGQNTSVSDDRKTVFFGLDSVLDFRLAEGVYGDANNAPLRDVLLGNVGPQTLFNRIDAQRERALNRGELGRYLVTFIDNHDSFWQSGRIGALANDDQLIGCVGFLLCALGTPCLYYGTEQGLAGTGGDTQIREAMFDATPNGQSHLNKRCRLYQEIAKIASVMRTSEPLRFGRMYYRQISGDRIHFGLPYGTEYTLAFCRILYKRDVLVAYNISKHPRSDAIVVDATLHSAATASMTFLYGGNGSIPVQQTPNGTRYVALDLSPNAFVILE